MATDADEATTALIAKLLAEDQGGDYEYDRYGGGDSDSNDSDWGGGKKKKKAAKKPAAKKEKAEGAAPRAKKAPAERKTNEDGEELTATGRRKRKDTGQKRAASRPYTPEEEKLFLEGLELFGRNWKQISAHMQGSRDERAVSSHAQKHFIRLCLQGRPLPAKVAESGEGYTLSGKPLDPNSSAARQYGFKPDTLQKLEEAFGADVLGGLTANSDPADGAEDKENVGDEDGAPAAGGEAAAAGAAAPAAAVMKPAAKRPKKAKAATAKEEEEGEGAGEGAAGPGEPPPQTEYAKNRPRREGAAQPGATFRSTGDSLELTAPLRFPGVSLSSNGQPFRLEVSPAALVLMDAHAHMCTNEVIGFLGGSFDRAARVLRVARAFPGRGRASGRDVEMDPIAEVELRDSVTSAGLTVVGWYHSHPVFPPNPSGIDVDNQRNYQALFRCAETGAEPFVGFIVGPYDLRLPTPSSKVQTFVSRKLGGEDKPFELDYSVAAEAPGQETLAALRKLVDQYAKADGRIHPCELWRPFANFQDRTPSGGPVTKMAKMRASLRGYFAAAKPALASAEVEGQLDELGKAIQQSWGVDLGYVQ